MKHKKLIYVCSKLRGNVGRNIVRANIYSRFVYEHGHIPIAPHCIFTQFLNDESKAERLAGMEMGMQMLTYCNEMWVFGLDISDGMQNEINEAKRLGTKIKYFNEDMEEIG